MGASVTASLELSPPDVIETNLAHEVDVGSWPWQWHQRWAEPLVRPKRLRQGGRTLGRNGNTQPSLWFCRGGSSPAGPASLSEGGCCFTTHVCCVSGWLALHETRPEKWKGRKGRISLWEHMEMTKLTPLGPQAASACPAGPEQPCVIKHSSLEPFWLGRRHKGRTQQGFFLFSCLVLGCLHSLHRSYWAAAVCERERGQACALWRRLMSPALFLLSLVVLWILFYVYCLLTFLKKSLQSRKPYS